MKNMIKIIRVFLLFFLVLSINVEALADDMLLDNESKGDSLYQLGQLNAAINSYSLEFEKEKAKKNPDVQIMMNLMASLGSACEDAGQLDDALRWYLMYENMADLYSPLEKGNALNLIGNVYFRLGDFSIAIEYYFSALYISQINSNLMALSSASNNIGNVYFSLRKYEEADKYYQTAILIKQKLGDLEELPSCLINAGNVKMLLEDYENSEKYFRRALQISKSTGNQYRALSSMVSLGILFERLEKQDSAYAYFEKAMNEIDTSQLSIEYIMTLRGLGALELNDEKYFSALNYLEKALLLSEQANLTNISADIIYLLAEASENAHIPESAMKYYKRLNQLNDSLFDTELSEKLSQYEASYESILKKKTIEMQELEIKAGKKVNKFLIWLIVIISVSLIAIAIAVFRVFRNKNKYQKQVLESRIHEVRLQALRAQINPHFISNALNSIQSFFINGDIEQATDYLADFGSLIRMVLDNSNKSFIPLPDEVNFLKLYIKLEQLRMNGHFSFEVEIESSLQDSNLLVPPLVVQPYVENAIWHGLSHKESKGHLIVKYIGASKDIRVIIEDNGVGMSKSRELYLQYPKKRKSYAMSINIERVKLFQEYFQRDLSTKIIDLCTNGNYGTRVEILIPGIERNTI